MTSWPQLQPWFHLGAHSSLPRPPPSPSLSPTPRQVRDALQRVAQGAGVRLRCGARVSSIRSDPSRGGDGGSRVTGAGPDGGGLRGER
jgi:hypothetical protein